MKKITTVEQVIAAFGGRRGTADFAGVGPTAVSNWKRAGRIARSNYPLMIAALREAGLTAPASLWGMKEATHRSRRRSLQSF